MDGDIHNVKTDVYYKLTWCRIESLKIQSQKRKRFYRKRDSTALEEKLIYRSPCSRWNERWNLQPRNVITLCVYLFRVSVIWKHCVIQENSVCLHAMEIAAKTRGPNAIAVLLTRASIKSRLENPLTYKITEIKESKSDTGITCADLVPAMR